MISLEISLSITEQSTISENKGCLPKQCAYRILHNLRKEKDPCGQASYISIRKKPCGKSIPDDIN